MRARKPARTSRSQRNRGPKGASFLASEDRPAERMRENVVDVKMQLGDEADAVSALIIHRKDRLGGELHMLPGPDEAGIDRAGRAAAAGPCRRREREFDDRRQLRNKRAEAQVAHIVLEIEQAVLDRAAPFDRLGLVSPTREGISKRAGNGERPQKFHAVGEIAEAFAQLDRRRESRASLGDRLAAGAANLPIQPRGEDELVLWVAIDFQR